MLKTPFRWLIPISGFILLSLILTVSFQPAPLQAQGGGQWTAQFYNSDNFQGNIVATTSYNNGLNFVWTSFPLQQDNVTPVAGVNADRVTVRFNAQIPLNAGTYTFSGTADDRVSVLINGVPVYNYTGTTFPQGQFQFAYTAPTTTNYSIEVRFTEFEQTAQLNFTWQLGAGNLPTPTPSGPFADVVNVRGLSLRTGPYLGASFIAVLRPENSYPVSAKNATEGGGYTWYQVTAGDRVGWASGRYLIVNQESEVPFATTIFEELANPTEVPVIAIPRAIMNLRQFPSQRSTLLDQIPWGAEIPLYNRTIQGGRNHWFQVQYEGQIGWIFAPYVGWRGNIDQVPIR